MSFLLITKMYTRTLDYKFTTLTFYIVNRSSVVLPLIAYFNTYRDGKKDGLFSCVKSPPRPEAARRGIAQPRVRLSDHPWTTLESLGIKN